MNEIIILGKKSDMAKKDTKVFKAVTEGVISPILKAECYVLSDGRTIIRGRGYIRSLSGQEDDKKQSGQKMERMLNNKSLQSIIPKELIDKLSTKILVETKNKKIIEGFDATTLPRLAIALWEAYLTGKIEEGHAYYKEAKNSENLVKGFGDMGITGHIYQITGYSQIKGALEIIDFFNNQYVRDLPSGHKRKFEEIGFFNGLYKIYNIKRNEQKPWQHPQFFGHIINKYIYLPLDIIMTDGRIQTSGILKVLLKEKKSAGRTLYSFIEEIGEAKFFGHLGTLSNLARIAKNPKDFEKLFYQFFPDCDPNSNQLPLFPQDFMNLAKLDMKQLMNKQLKADKSMEDQENIQIIKNIQQDLPYLETNSFEDRLEEISITKTKK